MVPGFRYQWEVMSERTKVFSVFLLEDDIMYKKMLAYAFGKDPELDLSFFQTGKSFLEQFKRKAPNIVIMDYSLPDLSGRELLAGIRERAPELPVVIISGSVSPETIETLYREGIYEFLAKDILIRARLQNVLSNIKKLLKLQAENEELRGRRKGKKDT